MIITIANNKGGVGKTTTAYHFAAYFQQQAPTLLIDWDPGRNALGRAQRGGASVPFKVVPSSQGAMHAAKFKHIINDTKAREDVAELRDIAEGCDLLVIPVEPGADELQTTLQMIDTLRRHDIPASRYRVLVTKVPPPPERDGEQLHEALNAQDIPVFTTMIPRMKVFKIAAQLGVPVYDVKQKSADQAWNEYVRVCEEIAL